MITEVIIFFIHQSLNQLIMKKQTFSKGLGMSLTKVILLSTIVLGIHKIKAQVASSSELYIKLEKMDKLLFDKGFNQCLHEQMLPHISDDLEFYHDQSGVTNDKTSFMDALKNNICANSNFKPIRKLTPNSLLVYPLYNNGVLYGAIQNGIHEFYIKEPNKELYLTSTALFSHVWLLKNKVWTLKRVLSFNHQVPKKEIKNEVTLSNKTINKYIGSYVAPHSGSITISKKNAGLLMQATDMQLELLPETKTVFYNKDAPLTFEFAADKNGNVVKMIIREHGKIVEEAKRVK